MKRHAVEGNVHETEVKESGGDDAIGLQIGGEYDANKCSFQMRCWCTIDDILRTSPRPSTMVRADRQKWAGASSALAKLNEGCEQPRRDATQKNVTCHEAREIRAHILKCGGRGESE